MRPAPRLLPTLAPLVAGCLGPPGEVALGHGDTGEFVERVEPILAESCANPSCHGNGERPFQVFAVHRHRLDPDLLFSDAPLTPEEHAANFDQARGFGAPAWELCRKPLAPEAGGMAHDGGDFWNTTEDVDYQAIRAWLEGR